MQIQFEEITVPSFPGALFQGSADFEWDPVAQILFAEAVTLHELHNPNGLTKTLTHRDGLFAEFERAIETTCAARLCDMIPRHDPNREHRMHKNEFI